MEYYINLSMNGLAHKSHKIHHSNCGCLDWSRNSVHLGSFKNDDEALVFARTQFPCVTMCFYCSDAPIGIPTKD